MDRRSLKNIYAYTAKLPWGLSSDELQSYLCEHVEEIGYAAPSIHVNETGESVLRIRPQSGWRLQHNSFRPDMDLSEQRDTLSISCSLSKLVRRFIGVLSCVLLLFQIVFLVIADPSAPIPMLLPLLLLLFVNLMSIAGLRLTSRRLIEALFSDAFTKAG